MGSNTAQLILDQLRESLDGVRYSSSAVLAGLVVSLGGAIAVAVVFTGVWHMSGNLYCTRIQPHGIQPRFRESWKRVWTANEAECIEEAGLDAAVYLRALRMMRHVFIVLTILVCSVAIPVNVVYNLRSPFAKNLTRKDALLLTTPSLLQGKDVIPHVVLGWCINAVLFAFLWYNFAAVLRMRSRVLGSPFYARQLVHRTVMALDIPAKFRSVGGIAQIAAACSEKDVRPTGIAVGHSTKQLEKLVTDHGEAVRRYEQAYYAGKTPSDKLAKLKSHIDILSRQIADERQISRYEAEPRSFGFVSYATMIDAHHTARKGAQTRINGVQFRLAPEPREIIWPNLQLGSVRRGSKQTWINCIYGAILILWIVPNAFIGCFLSNLGRLAVVWPAFGTAMAKHRTLFAVLQGFLAPIVTSTVFSLLPFLFRRFGHWQGKLTRIDREHEVLRKLYVFFFLDNYFVFSITGVIWDIVAQTLSITNNSPSPKPSFSSVWHSLRVPERISTAIVNISSFWVMYLLRAIFGVTFEMLEILTLLKRGGQAVGVRRPSTPREKIESSKPQQFQYAVQYLSTVFLSTVALGFTSIQPLVLPVIAVYFILAVSMKKYTLLYNRITKYESNGLYWPLINNMILFSTAFGNLMLLCVVWVQAGWKVAVPVCPLPATVIIFKIASYLKFDRHFYYVEATSVDWDADWSINGENKRSDRRTPIGVGEAYENPAMWMELDKPLLSEQDAFENLSTYNTSRTDFNESTSTNSILKGESTESISSQNSLVDDNPLVSSAQSVTPSMSTQDVGESVRGIIGDRPVIYWDDERLL